MVRVTGTQNAKITIKGTSIELSTAEIRLEASCPADGKTLSVALYVYEEGGYAAGKPFIQIEGFQVSNKNYDLALGTDPETYSPQSVATAHAKVIAYLESLSYIAEEV